MFISSVFVYLSIYVICEYIAEAPVILASGPQAVTVRAGMEQHDNKCENILILSILKQSTEDLEKKHLPGIYWVSVCVIVNFVCATFLCLLTTQYKPFGWLFVIPRLPKAISRNLK